jgi:caffeoyl-CoA O-methyltransferase
MTNKSISMNDALYEYLLSHSLREPDILRRLREETAGHTMSAMQIAPEQGQFMALLLQILNARKCLEIGVFTGYSTLACALVLPDNAQIIACDVEPQYTDIAQRYWQEAGVENKIDLRIAPALNTLDSLLADGNHESFDFAFIDADKTNYQQYYERCLQLLRPSGLMMIDNVLWSGSVADMNDNQADTQAIRALNEFIAVDQRVDISMLPVADGIMLARKR